MMLMICESIMKSFSNIISQYKTQPVKHSVDPQKKLNPTEHKTH